MGEKLSQNAFSLVELMITIGIIALVAAAALGSVSAIQKSSRDTQRKADLNTIKSALQQYYANENHYPDSLVLTAGAAINSCTGLSGCTNPTRTYLSTTPKDPTGVAAYYYCSQTSVTNTAACSGGTSGQCHYYALCATLENPNSTTSCTCGGTTSGNVILNPL